MDNSRKTGIQECKYIRTLGKEIRGWVKKHAWYEINAETNQYKLEQQFGGAIEHLAGQLDYHGQPKLRRVVLDCWDHLMAKCMKIDAICRVGCRNEVERLELEFQRSKAVGAAYELAEVLELLLVKSEIRSTKSETNLNFQNSNNTNGNPADCYISFAEAAALLGVTKSTVSKWAKKGRFKNYPRE